MGVYAIGDIQGCADSLYALLAKIGFRRARDELWFTGDLVNRGPRSAEVLRFVIGLGERAHTVLGNHDLHLLALAAGRGRWREEDSLRDVLEADDRVELLEWLRRQPLLHHDDSLGYTMVHAGLAPQWDLATAQALAHEAEEVVRDSEKNDFFSQMYGDAPDCWDAALQGWDRLRFAINVFTRMRFCDGEGRMDLRFKGAPGSQPEGLYPWFEVPDRRSSDLRIVFGHWSALGFWRQSGVVGLDSGCLWGGSLSALRLDGNNECYSVPCQRQAVSRLT